MTNPTDTPTLREVLNRVAAPSETEPPNDGEPNGTDPGEPEPEEETTGDIDITVEEEPDGVQAELMPGMGIDYERLVTSYAARTEELAKAKERRQQANDDVKELTESLKDLKLTIGPWLLRQDNQEVDVEIPMQANSDGEIVRYKRMRVAAAKTDEVTLTVGLRSMEVTCPHGVTYWDGDDAPCGDCQLASGVTDFESERNRLAAEREAAAEALDEELQRAVITGGDGTEESTTEIEQEPQH